MKIQFIGDISLNNRFIELCERNTNPFKFVVDFFNNSDLVVGNLECILKGSKGENLLRSPRLNTNLETLNYLASLHLGLVTLAHNHIFDNLQDGFNNTLRFLNEKHIIFIGAGVTKEDSKNIYIYEKSGVKIGFLNYVTEDTNPNIPENSGVFVNLFQLQEVLNDIKKNKPIVDHLVLLLHWGGKCEGGYYPDWEQPQIARILIDAGADLIIGTHSHTLQPYEVYKGKHIFYSLGNFCFADVVSDGKVKEIEWGRCTESIILEIDFNNVNYTVDFVPIDCKGLTVVPKPAVIKKWGKRNRKFPSIRDNFIKWKRYYFFHKKINPIFFFFFGNNHNFFKQLFKLNLKKIFRFIKK
ncbi:MAG: hypothetical protein A2W91_07220 [Bacteroidetes bacterium GWF2_38_335]|nr:MAG: hypothetical protein A2W91_07220 [Bacteroidetes bacterium GWF2_38_335]OFY77118.1 MAG: hypothetical protein A2281_14455 [Bacteroidetes bacterium RIFOXYA12_FULL_38_20]HBS85009.1 hypothetical protein [Bacteroidales bacterium]